MFLYLNRWGFDHTLSDLSKPRHAGAQTRFCGAGFYGCKASRETIDANQMDE
jgi:hypothetical protein